MLRGRSKRDASCQHSKVILVSLQLLEVSWLASTLPPRRTLESMPVSLVDLPTEILLKILEDPDVSTETIYSLALLSRRLHITALPVYFERHGLNSQSRSIPIAIRTDRRDILTALRTALFNFMPLLDTVVCFFSRPSCTSILPFLEQVKRLDGFIASVPSLKDVTLYLGPRGGLCLSGGSDESLREWARGFGSLLNCVVRNHCVSFTILYGTYFTDAFELRPAKKPTRRVSRIIGRTWDLLIRRGAATHELTAFRRASQQGRARIEIPLSPHCALGSQLTTLHIRSKILILPPALSWTLDVLRTCPVSTLTFSEISVESRLWGTVLPLISTAATNVSSVSFQKLHINDSDVMEFANDLPHLTHIEILTTDSYPVSSFSDADVRLPLLTSLRAHPRFVQHLLARRDSLPALRHLCLCPTPSSLADVAAISRDLSAIIRTFDAQNIASTLSVVICSLRHGLLLGSAVILDLSTDLRASLRRFDALELSVYDLWEALELATQEMVDFIVAFHRARKLSIMVECPHPELDQAALSLVALIPSSDFLFLRTMEVNGQVYTLGDAEI
jgi:hypothetical protein